ncbi:heat shock protein Hsp90 [Phanerochaete sordida]|uniref:Heat shock protein Hsp90 n=1 Tax=Phanerochaete sordida TaxID=48140 RepID=A0A9P3FX13_9APHY|nr:heat shock protein Hsp90 [Phanerochaete sordida]
MRVFRAFLLSFTVLAASLLVLADGTQKYDYQSDVARLRKIVINSLYSHRDVFLRELISNANDALEKLRLTSLTVPEVLEGAESMNITIKAFKDEDGTAKLVIRDTGIGMNADELTANLGTLAKSGTSEFLARAESSDSTGTGNLIGAFGLGFYSSFLVADKVYVASLAAKSPKNPQPQQYVFSSSSDESTFEVYPDPRGNVLGRGTEITLILKEDALEYLDTLRVTELVSKHSSFATAFPIYLHTTRTEEVPVDEEEEEVTEKPKSEDEDEDEAVVEDVEEEEEKPKKTKSVTVEEWVHLNSQPPIWMRDPKTVTEEEYELFYQSTFKDYEKPLGWAHFSGDSAGTSFKAILYIPSRLDDSFWQNPQTTADIRLMVKRVFITSDLGEDALPKWASWVKVVVDADDLPLNVSRETLQSTRFLKQLKSIIVKRLIQTLAKIAEKAAHVGELDVLGDDAEMSEEELAWWRVSQVYNNALKLGAVEDTKNRERIAPLVRFPSNQRNETSLDRYVEGRKQGQKQIFYLADMGKTPEALAKSVFVEKLHARGYEVLLLGQPLDEIFVQSVRTWKKLPFQDVAKAGLKFGDEEEDPEEEKERQKELTEQYKPLLEWFKNEAKDAVRNVVISNRLVTSPCAIVADAYGYTANMEKMLNAQNQGQENKRVVHDFAKKMKTLEINPRSPLIEGLLKRVEQLPAGDDAERDLDAEAELREVTSVLIDGALVRSGFEVPDSHDFFARVDRILRRSLGVSEHAPTDARVKPAPPVAPALPEEDDFAFDETHVQLDPEMLGLKVGEPVLEDVAEEAQTAWKVESHDEL